MNQLPIFTVNGQEVRKFTLPSDFEILKKVHKQSLFDAVLLERASRRQGTHSTKTKAEVSGTGKKPYSQKKTGNARQGSRRNPQFVGGGIVFGPKPNRNYTKKMNRKVHALAFVSALSTLFHDNKLVVLADELMVDQKPSAKTISDLLINLKLINKKLLLITNENNNNLFLSARNLKKVTVKLTSQVSVMDLLSHQQVLVQETGLSNLLKMKVR